MKILYAGDSPAGGPANYLLGILRSIRAEVTHVPPSDILTPEISLKKYDAVILSDFSKKNLPPAAEKNLVKQIENGAGLLMVGGWGSFSGPFGGWRGSEIEKLLPVQCLTGDDRLNFPGGACLTFKGEHPALKGIPIENAPVICGLNQVQPKPSGKVVLTVRRVLYDGKAVRLEPREHPLLIIADAKGKRGRSAALATDFAPHWCGGLIDWGAKSVKLPVVKDIRIEIGETYLKFGSQLISWTAGK